MLRKNNLTKIALILLLVIVISLKISQPVLAGTYGNQECYDICESGSFDDEMKELCLAYYDDDYGSQCLEQFSEDYEDNCMEEFNDQDFGGSVDHFSSGSECVETYDGYYDLVCLEDHAEEMGDMCLDDHFSEMMDECVDLYAIDQDPYCCPNPDDVYIEELGECEDSSRTSCVDQGRCNLDGGSSEFGECDGRLGSDVDGASADCITEEEYDCLDSGMVWLEGDCYDEQDVRDYACGENGYFWSESLETCFETEKEKNCEEEDKYYSSDLDTCFETYDELTCAEEGNNYFEGECLNENAYECREEGQFYCESSNDCVDSIDACCEDENLYVEIQGDCADSEEEADCLNQGYEWDSAEEQCLTDESGTIERSSDSQETTTGSESTTESSGQSTLDSSTQKQTFKNARYDPTGKKHNYVYRATTTSTYELYKKSSEEILPHRNVESSLTGAEFSPDGKRFIYGVFVAPKEGSQDRRVDYRIVSFNQSKRTYIGHFDILKENAFYQHDFTNQLLLDWNKEDHKIYFLSKGTNDQHNEFKVKSYYTGSENDQFESKRISDLQREFPTEFQTIVNNKIGLYDSFFDSSKLGVNKAYFFNPEKPYQVLVSAKSNTENTETATDKLIFTLNLEHGQNYNLVKSVDHKTLAPTNKLPNTNYYKFSEDGKFIIFFKENNFYMVRADRFFEASKNSATNNIDPDYILEAIIPENKLSTTKLLDFAFDNKYFGEDNLPKGIFYAEYDMVNKKSTINYVSLEDGSYFPLYSVDENYIDDIEVNPVNNQLLIHSCDYFHPEVQEGSYFGETKTERFLKSCKLDLLNFNRKIHMNVLTPGVSKLNLASGLKKPGFKFEPKVNILPTRITISENDLQQAKKQVRDSKDLLDLAEYLDGVETVGSGFISFSGPVRDLMNFNLRKRLFTKEILTLNCGDLKNISSINSKINNKDELLINIFYQKEKNCRFAIYKEPLPSINCDDLETLKNELKSKSYRSEDHSRSEIKKNSFSRPGSSIGKYSKEVGELKLSKEDLLPAYLKAKKSCTQKFLNDLKQSYKDPILKSHEQGPLNDKLKTDNNKTDKGTDNEKVSINSFYEDFFKQTKVNVIVTRNDHFEEKYELDLQKIFLKEGQYKNPDAIIQLDEKTLENLLSSKTILLDFYQNIESGRIIYEKPKSKKGLFGSINDFFGSIFDSKNKKESKENGFEQENKSADKKTKNPSKLTICDDGNSCTKDIQTKKGCSHEKLSDGFVCGKSKICKEGICVTA